MGQVLLYTLFDDLYSAEMSVSGEAGDGEEPGEEEQPSVEALPGEQLKTADDCSQLAGKYRLTAWFPWRHGMHQLTGYVSVIHWLKYIAK